MIKKVKVRHPAGVIRIDDDGRALEVDATLPKHAVGSLLHARSPLMAPAQPCAHGGDVHGEDCQRRQVGTAMLVTYRTELDGSAVDLEWELDFPDPEPPPPDPTGKDFIRADGIRETWTCDLPPDGSPFVVVREEWTGDGQHRTIHQIRLLK